METNSKDCIEMPSLGRPFRLGMLYDCRSEKLVPGITLWNPKLLQENIDKDQRKSSDFKVIVEDTVESKSNALKISASLKASFLGGLVSVEGSAKYLDDRKTSKAQSRVTLQYTMKSRFEQLTMSHLAYQQIEYPNVFDIGNATHVVTGILYGADAFFIFDREIGATESERQVAGELEAVVKGIPMLEVAGKGAVEVDNKDVGNSDKLHCTFYGDFCLKRNPYTFPEAIDVYRNLPNLLGDNDEHVVPKIVWLYPLQNLDSKAGKLVREISVDLVNEIQLLFENFHDLRLEAKEIHDRETYNYFPATKASIGQFINLINEYVVGLQKKILPILPKIRGGALEEIEIANIIGEHRRSIFAQNKLNEWLNGRSGDEKQIFAIINSIKKRGIDLVSTTELYALTGKYEINYVSCFNFMLDCSLADPFLSLIKIYLEDHESLELKSSDHNSTNSWNTDGLCTEKVNSLARHFIEFFEINKPKAEEDKIKFCCTSTTVNDYGSRGANVLLYTNGKPQIYIPPSTPGLGIVVNFAQTNVTLNGFLPKLGSNTITGWEIAYQVIKKKPSEHSEEVLVILPPGDTCTISNLEPGRNYNCKIRGICLIGKTNYGPSSIIETAPPTRLATRMKSFSTFLPGQDFPKIYQLPMTEIEHDKKTKIKIYEVGEAKNNDLPCAEKVVIMLGATGSGKTTVINGMANYIFGVQWKDDFRFKVITELDEGNESQAKSQTKYISTYQFHQQSDSLLKYSVKLIDTPGFGDTDGIKRDEEIVKQIRELFERRGRHGIDHLDAIGFVVQAPNARLTPTQQYIMDSVLSLFGKDAVKNIYILITFADGGKPQVLSALDFAKLDYKAFYKFNNSALYSDNKLARGEYDDEDDNFDEMFWKIGLKSYRDFFNNLATVEPQSLQLTREVLKERQQLETSIQGLQVHITAGLNKLEEIRTEKKIIEKFEAQINANKDFKYFITVTKQKKIDLSAREYVTNCLICNFTCHFPCGIPNDADKSGCWAMNNSYCTVCPNKCYWDKHVNNSYRFELYEDTEQRTSQELQTKYQSALGDKSKSQHMIDELKAQFKSIQEQVISMIVTARNSINKLNEIAAKMNPLTTADYIDLLIKSEENGGRPGWKDRVSHLNKAKKQAEFLQKIRDPNFKPFQQYQDELSGPETSIARINIAEKSKVREIWDKFWN